MQVDLHPFMTRTDIVEYCTRHGILLEAWAPLVEAMRFNHPTITKLANIYDKEPAQILLRYSLQKVCPSECRSSVVIDTVDGGQGFIPLPKSSRKTRITSNTQIYDFALQKEDIECLDSLDEGWLRARVFEPR